MNPTLGGGWMSRWPSSFPFIASPKALELRWSFKAVVWRPEASHRSLLSLGQSLMSSNRYKSSLGSLEASALRIAVFNLRSPIVAQYLHCDDPCLHYDDPSLHSDDLCLHLWRPQSSLWRPMSSNTASEPRHCRSRLKCCMNRTDIDFTIAALGLTST